MQRRFTFELDLVGSDSGRCDVRDFLSPICRNPLSPPPPGLDPDWKSELFEGGVVEGSGWSPIEGAREDGIMRACVFVACKMDHEEAAS